MKPAALMTKPKNLAQKLMARVLKRKMVTAITSVMIMFTLFWLYRVCSPVMLETKASSTWGEGDENEKQQVRAGGGIQRTQREVIKYMHKGLWVSTFPFPLLTGVQKSHCPYRSITTKLPVFKYTSTGDDQVSQMVKP